MARKAAAQIDATIPPPPEQEVVPTEPVEIEITDAPVEPVSVQPEVESPPPAPPPEPDASIKQRLEEVQRANAELARKNAELTRQNNVGRQQYTNEQQQRFTAQYEAIVNAIGSAESSLDAAKQEYRTAHANGDVDALVEAQEKIGRATSAIDRLGLQKDQMDAWWENNKNRPQQPPQQEPPRQPTAEELRGQAETAIAQFNAPERVKTWLRNHMDYMTDPRKNQRLQMLHDLVVEQGYEAYSEPYIARVEELLGMKPAGAVANGNGAHRPNPPPTRQAAPVSAPPTREAPSMTTGRAPQSNKVTLSAEQQEIAWISREREDMTRQEANEAYARNLILMNKKKANGELS